jgi:hypothetical protein
MRSIALAFVVVLGAACGAQPEGVWTGDCNGTRDDDDSAFTMELGIEIVPEALEKREPPSEDFESEGLFRFINLSGVLLKPPEGEVNPETGEYRFFQVPKIVTCESAACRLHQMFPLHEVEPFTELNDSEGVQGDAWVVAAASDTDSIGGGDSISHSLVFFGHIDGESYAGDILWESRLRPGNSTEDVVRIGRGQCTLNHLPQGFFDDYNEL